MVMVGWRGTFVVSKVPNLLLLFLPPTPKSSEARRPQSLLPSWLCLAKSRLDFPGVQRDGNQGFEVSKTKVTGPGERCEQFACSSWDGEPFWNIYMRQEGRGTENSKHGLCFLPNLGTEHIPQGICKDPGKLWQGRYSQESSSENGFSASRNLGDVQEGAPVVTEINHLLVCYAEGLLQKFLTANSHESQLWRALLVLYSKECPLHLGSKSYVNVN